MAATKDKKPLTEAELLQMPDSDYMNEAQLAFFRQRLHNAILPNAYAARRIGTIEAKNTHKKIYIPNG